MTSKSGIVQALGFSVNSSPDEKALVSNLRITRVKKHGKDVSPSALYCCPKAGILL